MNNSRNGYIDFVKAILIFLVILGHTVQIIRYNNVAFWNDLLFKSIYMFHMPLFIAISGYFTYFSLTKYATWDFIKSKFLYLFVPMVAWCILTFIMKAFITNNIDLPVVHLDE